MHISHFAYLFMYQWIWVTSIAQHLWIMLLWTRVCKYLSMMLLSKPCATYPEVELLYEMEILFLFFRNHILLSISTVHKSIIHLFHMFLTFVTLSRLSTLVHVTWNLIVVLIYISLILSNGEYFQVLFAHLNLWKILVRVLFSFFMWVFFYWILSYLHILNIDPLLDMHMANISSFSVGCFSLLTLSLRQRNMLKSLWSPIFPIFFYWQCL